MNTEQKLNEVTNILINLEKLLKENLPARIVGSKTREPSKEYSEILSSLEKLKGGI